jgi:hypothetical protein
MIFPEFVEFLARRARAVSGSGVTLHDAVDSLISSDILLLRSCNLARK